MFRQPQIRAFRLSSPLLKQGGGGFTKANESTGRGSETGEPHFRSHTWPTFNDAILTFVDDDKVDNIMNELHNHDNATAELGLRAFAWKIDRSI